MDVAKVSGKYYDRVESFSLILAISVLFPGLRTRYYFSIYSDICIRMGQNFLLIPNFIRHICSTRITTLVPIY